MQWMSLFLVIASDEAALLTHDPRLVMVKPSLIYIAIGIVMLKPGWMNRYLLPRRRQSCRTSPSLSAASGRH